jgi:hypothetical protein
VIFRNPGAAGAAEAPEDEATGVVTGAPGVVAGAAGDGAAGIPGVRLNIFVDCQNLIFSTSKHQTR